MQRSAGADVDGVDLSLYMSTRKIVSLGEADKAKLREVVRTHEMQKHFIQMQSGCAALRARPSFHGSSSSAFAGAAPIEIVFVR